MRFVEWTRGGGRQRAERAQRVDVIIPVYGAAAELRACLASVAAHTDRARHGVMLVVDGPQDAEVEAAIASIDARVIRNETRRGFAASVNRGMRETANDVVLLNSDTIVTERWIEKLIDAAYSDGDAGTVTPLSNNATLCSVPRSFEENLLPAHFDVDSFAALVERASAREYPRLPTGVGFCFYIRRALLDDVGTFDDERFAAGYGEENDFCMRALARGWLHVADDATFIFHAGHRSFAASRKRRLRHAVNILTSEHPRYMPAIAEFMRRDPLAAVRARITDALAPPHASELRIVHLVHGWPPFQHAGTELYAYWLARRQRARHHVAVYARGNDPSRGDGEAVEWVDGGVRVRFVTNHFTARDPLRRNAIRDRTLERDFERFLQDERPDLLHIHHLAGHAFSLTRVAKRLGIPIVMQLQDWWALCARVNRFHRDGTRCSGPAPVKCAACATLTSIPPAPITNRIMHRLRAIAARRALRTASAFIAGSQAIRNDYAGAVPASTPFHILPYGIAIDHEPVARDPQRSPIRFGYVGSLSPHKGVHTAVEAMRGMNATLHVWGDADAFADYVARMKRGDNVVFEGRFREEEKARVFAAIDVLLVPSIGLESFGLAAREAMASRVPVIATSGGALEEMFEPGSCGALFPPGDTAALRTVIGQLIDDPSIVDRWRAGLPKPKRDDVHAEEVEQVYRSVTAKRTEGRGFTVTSVLAPIVEVIRGEGLPSAIRRTRERVAESLANVASRFRRSKRASVPILNYCATSIAPRNGGVGIQLMTRLRAERALRGVALLHPGGLLVNGSLHRVHDVRAALAMTGARALHIEGMHGVPLDDVLRLIDDGIRVVITAHDFALFCEQPHLIEQSTNRFCHYSTEVDRCARCFGDQSQRRAAARTLLTSAAGVIFPSHFLLDRHRQFFSLPDLSATVIEPPMPLTGARIDNEAHREIAYAGSVKRHKGGHLLPDVARALAARNRKLHVFGGGDRELLQPLREHPNVVIHGYHRAGTLPSLLARHRIGLVLLASVWPETYSLTLSESWVAGACVAAFDLGAIAERVRRDGGGWLAPLESGAGGLIAIIDRWSSGAACTPPTRTLPSAEAAARAHMDLYRKLRL